HFVVGMSCGLHGSPVTRKGCYPPFLTNSKPGADLCKAYRVKTVVTHPPPAHSVVGRVVRSRRPHRNDFSTLSREICDTGSIAGKPLNGDPASAAVGCSSHIQTRFAFFLVVPSYDQPVHRVTKSNRENSR